MTVRKPLPASFTLSQSRSLGWSKDAVYALVDAGQLDRVGRGVFVDAARLDPSLSALAGATAVQPMATMCLTSALVWHGLSDAIPQTTDIALPRGTRHPAGFTHVSWRGFDLHTFTIGRESIEGNATLHTYSPERTIIDCYRLAHLEGIDTANTALKRWLRQPGNIPSGLLEMARSFPRTQTAIRRALEVLL